MKNDVKIIVSAGMPRSGSTWLYNAIRLLLCRNKRIKNGLTCGWCEDINLEEQNEGTVLVKVHMYDKCLADKASVIFYSYRDLRDSLASYKRKFGGEPTVKMADHFVKNDSLWRNFSHYNMCYEKMLQDPAGILQEIASVLDLDGIVNIGDILREINELRHSADGDENEAYDKINLLHKNHITDGRPDTWRDHLDRKLVSLIETKHRDWFIANKYQI